MVTHSATFDGIAPRPSRSGDERRRPSLRFVDDWAPDEVSIPMRRSRLGTWIAAISGAALGVGAVALYSAGILGGATLNETPMTPSREPNLSAVGADYQSAVLVQARAVASSPVAVASSAAESAPPAPVSTPESAPRNEAPVRASVPSEAASQAPLDSLPAPSEAANPRSEAIDPAGEASPESTTDNPY